MIMIVVMATAAFLTVFMVVVMMVCLFLHLFQLILQGCTTVDGCQNLFACENIPICCYQSRIRIFLPDALYCITQLFRRQSGCMAENDTACMLNLVIEKLAEVFLIHLALFGINHRYIAFQFYIFCIDILHSTDDIAEFAHTRRFNQNPIRRIGFQHLLQCRTKVTHQTTADTAAVHFRYRNSGILQKSSVNTNFTELIFNQNQLFSCVSLSNQLFNQSCFTGTQEAGENMNFCHVTPLLSHIIILLKVDTSNQ